MKFLSFTFLFFLTSSFPFSLVTGEGDEPECTYGKLYISSRNSTTVHVYDLNQGLESMYNEKNISLPPSATNELWLDLASDSQFVAVVYRGTADVGYTNGVVDWINTGFAKEDHGDHYHLTYGTPALVPESRFACARPIHFTNHDNKIAIFCDGSYEYVPQVNSTVWVIDETKLGTSNTSAVVHNTTLLGSHHGIAVGVDDNHILYSLATPDRVDRTANGTLYAIPWTFQITDYSGKVLHSISDTSNKDLHCSGYHGSAAKRNTFFLACDGSHGGVLIVSYNPVSATYISRALYYPPGFTGHRTGTLTSHDKSQYVIGNFALGTSHHLLAFDSFDTAGTPLTNSSLLPLSARQCGFEFEKSDGEYILNFMPNGTLSVYTYSTVTSWQLLAQVVVVPNMASCTQAAFVPGHTQAFVMHYESRTLYAIALDKAKDGILVVTTTSLPFTPLSGVVSGAPELYSCSMKPKEIIATVAPSASPSNSPTSAPDNTVPSNPEACGMFGMSIFCIRRGKCGFFRRLMKMGDC